MSHSASLSQGLQFGIVTENGITNPSTIGGLVNVNDAFIKSIENKNLIIQSGSNGSAIYIDVNNNIGIGKNASIERLDIDRFIKSSDGFKIANQNQAIVDENANLYLSGQANILSDISANGNLTILGTTTIEGLTIINDILTITGITTIQDNLIVNTNTFYVDTSNNNVGIGTAFPNEQFKLHVAGDVCIEGDLTINGDTIVNTIVENTTERLIVTNNGTGPALEINQIGAQSIVQFKDDNNVVFEIKDGGDVDISQSVFINNNLDVSNNVDISGNLNVSGIATIKEELYAGPTFIGQIDISNNAYLSHRNNKNITDFSLMQTSIGKTIINSKLSAEEINFTFGGENNIKQSFDKNGNIIASGNVFTYSDARLKYNIKQLDNGLEKVLAMRGVTFNMYQDIIDGKDGRTHIGLIAQEVDKIVPQAIFEDNNIKTIAYGNLVGLLIEAIKELKNEINELKIELNTIKL